MSSLSPKDRVSLCSFTFADGRRCRTPRTRNNPRFCPYHAQKEARVRAAQSLGKDLDYFFSGDYLSACDLSTALGRLLPAVVRGDVKPKTARTVAYMAQTLLQAIHLSKHEYINAFGTDGWRKSIHNSVNGNRDYLFPPDPEPEQPALSALRTNLRSESLQPQPQPAPPSNPPYPPAQPIPTPQPSHSPIRAQAPPTLAPAPSPTSARAQTPASHPTRSSLGCHAERSEASHPIPATQPAPSPAPAAPPNNPPRTGPTTPQPAPNRDARALHFDHNYHLRIDGKPF